MAYFYNWLEITKRGQLIFFLNLRHQRFNYYITFIQSFFEFWHFLEFWYFFDIEDTSSLPCISFYMLFKFHWWILRPTYEKPTFFVLPEMSSLQSQLSAWLQLLPVSKERSKAFLNSLVIDLDRALARYSLTPSLGFISGSSSSSFLNDKRPSQCTIS